MNKIKALTVRNIKEITRDKLSLVFCICLPVVLFVCMELLFQSVAEAATMFEINNFSHGIATFGFTFVMLFIALMVSNDRSGAFMYRIYASPTKNFEYVLSFILATVPVSVFQMVIFYLIALCFGLNVTANLIIAIVLSIFTAIFYASCGILIGTICKNEKQAGPLCSIIITAGGLLGGVWMPVEAMGETFLTICKCLPFYNGVNLAKSVSKGNFSEALISLLIVLGYLLVVFTVATIVFEKKSKK